MIELWILSVAAYSAAWAAMGIPMSPAPRPPCQIIDMQSHRAAKRRRRR